MKLSELGESEFIRALAQREMCKVPGPAIGIGDDCALIPQLDGSSLLITTDMLVADTHFLRREISAVDLGYKSLAVNLSDIAAMGGTPKFVFLSLALKPDTEIDWLNSFLNGFENLAHEFGVTLIGGDTTRTAGPIVINVALLGHANKVKLRSTARTSDIICVTGSLGDSGAGLRALLAKQDRSSVVDELIRRHHRPRPHVGEGQWLARQVSVHAMMDISDGIDSDLRRIMERSNCGARVDLEKLPISNELATSPFAELALEIAATAGEDYCLLLTVDPHKFAQLQIDYLAHFQKEIYSIGEVTAEVGILRYKLNGNAHSFGAQGFDHFR